VSDNIVVTITYLWCYGKEVKSKTGQNERSASRNSHY